jgi:hypothetical protein
LTHRALRIVILAAALSSSLLVFASASSPTRRPSGPFNGVNFISVCRFSHRAPDDPIMYPGRPGVSHDHSFVGNTSTDASSTLASLHKAGTTCQRRGDTAAYWMPTLYVAGTPVPPSQATIYYQRAASKPLRPFPQGLKMIGGNSMAQRPQSLLVTFWDCGDLVDVPRSSAMPTCPSGSSLRLRVNFPDCWNGRSLDSANHKSHMAYSVGGRCPRRHPVAVPALSVVYRYPTTGGPNAVLASGGQYSGHADFVNAWNQRTLAALVSKCLNRLRHCGTGS